jgi:outer membrane receptor protein involved in Fe transport
VKFPDITALYNELGYGGAVPPVTVKPEYAQDYEAGVRYQMDKFQGALNVYEEDFSDIIYSAPIPDGFGATEQLNGGNERYRGVELQLTDDFGEFYIGSWKGYLNVSYNEAVCTTASSNVLTGGSCEPGQSLANVPNYLLNAGLIWDYDGWHVDLQGHYVGQQHLQDYYTGLPNVTGDLEPGQMSKIPDYFLVNVGIIKVIPVNWAPAQAIRIGLHVDNLFDTHYYSDAETNTLTNSQSLDFYGLAGEPRAVFASVGVFF